MHPHRPYLAAHHRCPEPSRHQFALDCHWDMCLAAEDVPPSSLLSLIPMTDRHLAPEVLPLCSYHLEVEGQIRLQLSESVLLTQQCPQQYTQLPQR